MPNSKRQQEPRPDVPNDAPGSEPRDTPDIAGAREECLAKLKAIAAQVQELSIRSSAELARALNEAQMGLHMRQQGLIMDYFDKARQVSARAGVAQELNEISKRYYDDLQLSNEEARRSIDDTREKLRAAYDAGIAQANSDWNDTCLGFVDALRQRMAGPPPLNDPTELAKIGQSLTWIASLRCAPTGG